MKKLYIFAALVLAAISAVPPTVVRAETSIQKPVLIAAVQTGQEAAAGNDFVVLHNTTDETVDITGWKLQYRAASAVGSATWTTKRTVACVVAAAGCVVQVPARSNVLFATYAIEGINHQPLTSGFSDTGGQLRLVRPGAAANQLEVVDMVAYGNAAEAEGLPAAAPSAGQAIVRKHTVQQELVDTNNNNADFDTGCFAIAISEVPAAVSCEAPPVESPETETPTTPEVVVPPASEPEPDTMYLPLLITELLPDPKSPATDSADEFIELHNPHAAPVSVKGYMLQTGTDFRYQYSLGDVAIPAGGYLAIYSDESHLSLSNSGTAVRIIDPNGIVLDTVASYGQAKEGQSWAKSSAGWQWSLMPTPSAANIVQVETPKAVVAAATAAAKKAVTAKKATATTAKAAKAAAPKAAKTTASTAGAVQSAQTSKPQDSGTVQYWVLGGIGALILGYVIYEYRQNIARFGHKMRAFVWRKKQSQT